MKERMEFPKMWQEFIKEYSFVDDKKAYTDGFELIPVFRVVQLIMYYFNKSDKDG